MFVWYTADMETPTEPKPEMSVLNTRIPKDLHKRIRVEAARKDTEICKLVTACLSKCFPADTER